MRWRHSRRPATRIRPWWASANKPTDCMHLHSAFGPGCPHCWVNRLATPRDPADAPPLVRARRRKDIPMDDDVPTVEMPAVSIESPARTLTFDRMVYGELGELRGARAALRRWLNGCPAADDVLLVAHELMANAVLHSGSKQLYFIVRAEIQRDCIRVEVEDLGGYWPRPNIRSVGDDRPHGLDIVALLAEMWATSLRPVDCRRVTWAKISAPRCRPAVSAQGHLIATWAPGRNSGVQLALGLPETLNEPDEATIGPGALKGVPQHA